MILRANPTLLVLFFSGLAFGGENDVPAGRRVAFPAEATPPAELAKLIQKQTGTTVDVSTLSDKPLTMGGKSAAFWDSLDLLAERAEGHVVTTAGRIAIRPGKSKSPSFNSGAFRLSVREVQCRLDGENGKSNYVILIDVTWEPWLSALRLDAVPRVRTATDDAGKKLETNDGGSRAMAAGNFAELTVRPVGLTRKSQSLSLTGSVKITIADEWLTFQFDATNPVSVPEQKGVTVALKKHGKDGKDWFAALDIERPQSNVVIESHEYSSLVRNFVSLVPPKGQPIKADLIEAVDLRYGFKGMGNRVGAGWKLEVRTSGALREIVVPFDLKGIPLP